MKVDAKLKKRLMMAGSVFAIALGTGFIMQKVGPMAEQFTGGSTEQAVAKPVVEAPKAKIQPLSTALQKRPASETPPMAEVPEAALPKPDSSVGVTRSASLLPVPALQSRSEPQPQPQAQPEPVEVAALAAEPQPRPEPLSEAMPDVAQDCSLALSAKAREAAMVRLTLSAPCSPGEPVTLKHGPLTFTEVTDNEGKLTVDVPALSANAAFEASLDTGERASAATLVQGTDGFERTALSWQGRAGVALHAFENGADYNTEGHIDASAPAGPSRAVSGEGGFLTLLGAADMPGAMMAEVYSYPAAAGGSVRINIEAEVTAENCGREMSAEVMSKGTRGFAPQPLTVTMPACDAVGDYLVFSGILPEIRMAAAE
ncbi:hypothetical protein [Oceanicola sp. 502str15]|uniref:hypothetical protein n=1 Tax=Oceanicola sp. 502str15 TaxID=2696061 RepID=UPI002095CA9F|nr:hypothetical protein [Oceanicola sp. 502str15]MCO6384236.1 hypothetical protein [Oceanicola sp. 502str15]